jgi:hypothetical protein
MNAIPNKTSSGGGGVSHLLRFVGAALGIVGGVLAIAFHDQGMLALIYLVGEEKALGPENVVRLPDGAVLLTNPGAMIWYSLPYLIGGVLLIVLGISLLVVEFRCIRRRQKTPSKD